MRAYIRQWKGKEAVSPAPYPKFTEAAVSGLGGLVLISLLALIHFNWGALDIFFLPFGASAVLAFGAPAAPFSQPRNIIGGHFLAATVGFIVFNVFGHSAWWVLGLANGLAIAVMVATKTVHPPAGATSLAPAVSGITSPLWLLRPVLAGAVVIVLVALVYNNIWGRAGQQWEARKYPAFWV